MAGGRQGRVRLPRSGVARWLTEVAAAVVLSAVLLVAVRATLMDVYVIPTASMEPLLRPGDRVVASRLVTWAGDLQHGDVVVFDGSGSFGDSGRYAKRVVGVGGDRVTCCGSAGRLVVNGRPVPEPYVYPGDEPSDVQFDVVVPAGRLWVMGDHRSVSADSRAHLADPGGGMVREDRVIGRVVAVVWPLDRISGVGRADEVAAAAAGRTS